MKPKLFLCISIILAIIALVSFSYKEGFNNSNPNLIPNTGGPAWGQFLVNKTLLPATITYAVPIQVGTTLPITITPIDYGNYNANNTYGLGNVVTFNNLKYMCLAWTDDRGAAYSGSYNVSPTANTNAWAEVTVVPNPNLIPNTGGKFVVKKSLLPASITYGVPIQVGTTSPITITPSNFGNYTANDTYRLGNVVTFNNLQYMCLVWSLDTRGTTYQVTTNVTPTADTNAWARITVVAAPTSAGSTTAASTNAASTTAGSTTAASTPAASTPAASTTAASTTAQSRELEARLKQMLDERSQTLPTGDIKNAMMEIVKERQGTLSTIDYDTILQSLINARTLNPSSDLKNLVDQQVQSRLGTPTTKSPYNSADSSLFNLSKQFDTLDNGMDQTGLPGTNLTTPSSTSSEINPSIRTTPISNPLTSILPGLDKTNIHVSKDYSHEGREPWYKKKGNYNYSFDPENNPDTDC